MTMRMTMTALSMNLKMKSTMTPTMRLTMTMTRTITLVAIIMITKIDTTHCITAVIIIYYRSPELPSSPGYCATIIGTKTP